MTGEALYQAEVWHRRIRPRPHAFRYRVFYMLVDTDSLETGESHCRLLSFNRFNLFSIYRDDFGNAAGVPLRTQLAGILGRAGGASPITRVMMLALPRVLGYAFNPITVFYCYSDDTLAGVVYEVHNTFGEKHFYTTSATGNGKLQHSAEKAFHVSPFYSAEGSYEFRLGQPDRRITLLIRYFGADGALDLTAGLRGARLVLTSSNLLRLFLRIPLETLKVTFAIHYEAARLWCKRIPLKAKRTRTDGAVSECRHMTLTKDAR